MKSNKSFWELSLLTKDSSFGNVLVQVVLTMFNDLKIQFYYIMMRSVWCIDIFYMYSLIQRNVVEITILSLIPLTLQIKTTLEKNTFVILKYMLGVKKTAWNLASRLELLKTAWKPNFIAFCLTYEINPVLKKFLTWKKSLDFENIYFFLTYIKI